MEEQSNQQPQAVVNEPKPPQMAAPKKKSGTGKKILAVLLGLLVLGGVAYGTYYFTKQQAEEDAAAVIVPLQAQVAELEAKLAEMEASDSESAEGSYLEIEQWGVEIPIESGYEDLVYAISPTANIATFSTKSVVESDGKSCEATRTGLGALSRGKATDEVSASGITYDEVSESIKIKDYYYLYVSPQATCGNSTASEQQVKAVDDIQKMLVQVRASEE